MVNAQYAHLNSYYEYHEFNQQQITYECTQFMIINLIKLQCAIVRLNNISNHSNNVHLVLKLLFPLSPSFILL